MAGTMQLECGKRVVRKEGGKSRESETTVAQAGTAGNCKLDQLRAGRDAQIWIMAGKFGGLKNPRANCDHLCASGSCRQDVVRCVADETNPGALSRAPSRFSDGVLKHRCSHLALIAEITKAEIFAKAGRGNLVPAHDLKIPGRDSKQFSGRIQRLYQLRNACADFRPQGSGVGAYLAPDNLEGLLQATVESRANQACTLHSCAQNSQVGLAVVTNTIDRGVHAVDFQHCPVERVVVHQVARVQQGAVNVEEVDVEGVQLEWRRHEEVSMFQSFSAVRRSLCVVA